MPEPRISRRTGEGLARSVFNQDAETRLCPSHQRKRGEHCWCVYEMCPQADEWEPILGFAPDQHYHLEYGFMISDDELERSIVTFRALIDRMGSGAVVSFEWYPSAVDSRKRPS